MPPNANCSVSCRRPVSAALGTGEEPRLSPQCKSSKSTLGCIVREADPAILDESGKPVPTLEHVVVRLATEAERDKITGE
jgi:hypothetical protein